MKLMEEKKVNKHEHGQAMEMDSADGKPDLYNSPELQKDSEKLVISRDKRKEWYIQNEIKTDLTVIGEQKIYFWG